MITYLNDWEFWLDENISPIIAKWLMDEVKIKSVSFHTLKLNATPDELIYSIARKKDHIIIISKDIDFRELIAWKGTPPKLIAIEFGNSSNKIFWERLKSKIHEAISQLIYGDLDIFDIKK
ncbi:hypothetical protein GJU39_09200 [Pedobacter petrophilus]|uniref:DUF5615 domain-containing protein n=1 Tax=Pedobacter petrophilus TaxID=1908241 RepID=A0A7K0FXL0_9SPHI|nr:DUF5615 family PIN-like protein [Pedobacter petrophilus]MRX76265.1 hypothetical protein [Pedobacter petrophilus]